MTRRQIGEKVDVIILDDHRAVGEQAADLVGGVVTKKLTAVLGFATGTSPLTTYAALARRVQGGVLDFSAARGFALDEYFGLAPEHPQSYAAFIRREVIVPLHMDPTRVLVPDGRIKHPALAATQYEALIVAAGGIDIQILGIGSNGHLGFNEPGSSRQSRTRVAELSPTTRLDNSRFFDSPEAVPTHCITQGLGTIAEARRLVLVACGSAKATAVARALLGPMDDDCPASVIQLHPDVTIILDHAAAARLPAPAAKAFV